MAPRRAVKPSKARLADMAARGDKKAAFDLCLILRPKTITELVEFCRPSRNITTRGFDVLADALHQIRHVQERNLR